MLLIQSHNIPNLWYVSDHTVFHNCFITGIFLKRSTYSLSAALHISPGTKQAYIKTPHISSDDGFPSSLHDMNKAHRVLWTIL